MEQPALFPQDTMSALAPHVTHDLLAFLERLFPDKLPPSIISSEHCALLVGRQDVIRTIRAALIVAEGGNEPEDPEGSAIDALYPF